MIENHGVLSINVIPSILASQAFEVNKWKSGNGSLKPTVRKWHLSELKTMQCS